ncbi:MAG: TolB family protein [Gaiellaceae bacterium]
MKRRLTLGLALLAGALVAALVSPLSRAELPGKNGRIAYMVKDQAGHWQVWVANSDLSGAKELTRGHYDSGWAVWSPDGKRVAFDSNRTDRTPNNSRHVNDIFVMRSDGSGVKKLTDSKGASGDAAWSPSGSLIAFDADRGNRMGFGAIYMKRSDGRKLRRVTDPRPPLTDYSPRFSPDGTHLVFLRAKGTGDNAPGAIFTVRLDGSGLHRLTAYSLRAGDSDWSPDGKQIVFEAYPNPKAYGDIYVVDAAGGSAIDLTKNPVAQAGSADPVWSPDGRKILFLDNRRVNGVGRTGLATMNPDGSARQFVSSKNVEAHQADWESIAAGAQQAPKHELNRTTAAKRKARNGPLTLLIGPVNGVAHIVSVHGHKEAPIWHCPHKVFCGEAVSFAWGPDGRRVAFTLDEIGGTSPYVGFHVLNVVSGRDTRLPGGAPQTASTTDDPAAWSAYFRRMGDRVGCWPAANLAWSPDAARIAYNCGPRINVLELHGSGYDTVPTSSMAYWPTWSPSGTRIAYSTRLTPSKKSAIYTVALDGSHRRLVATGGAAPAWSPDGRTIAYQTRCGIRLITPSGRNTTPRAGNATGDWCGVIGYSGPPVWSPDGTKLGVEADDGVYVMNRNGRALHLVSDRAANTWYGGLPGRPSWRPIR